MITEKLIFKIPYEIAPIPDDFATIFGANYYDDWNFNDAGSLSLTGSLINRITSSGLNGGVFSSTASYRPKLTTDAIIGKDVADFDGVGEYMIVAGSTGSYNFLHNSSGGCVIIVGKVQDVNPNAGYAILANTNGGSPDIGAFIFFEDRDFIPIPKNNSLRSNVVRGVSGMLTSANLTADSAYLPQQYNSLVNVFDGGNATAAERNSIIINNGSEIKNNVDTNAASASNASGVLNLGASRSLSFFFKGQISRVIIADTIPTPTQLTKIQTRLNYDYGTFPIS